MPNPAPGPSLAWDREPRRPPMDLREAAHEPDSVKGEWTPVEPGPPALSLQLLDGSLGIPVCGEVVDAGNRSLGSTTPMGEALIPWEGDGPGALTARAFGFLPAVVSPTPLDLGRTLTVEMIPLGTARIAVVDRSGEPLEEVQVRVRPVPTGTHPVLAPNLHVADSDWVQIAATDALGNVEVSLSSRAIAELEGPSGARAQVLVVPGTGPTRVTLDRHPARVLITDSGTQEPRGFFGATLTQTNRPGVREVEVVSDQDGAIPIPAGANGVVLRLTDPRRRTAQPLPGSRFTGDRDGMYFRFDRAEPGEVFGIEVNTCSVSLVLVDAETGLPLTGVAATCHERIRLDKKTGAKSWSSSPALRRSVALRSGGLSLDCIFLPTDPRVRIRIGVPGYREEVLLHTDLVPGAEPRVVPMERGEVTVAITLRHRDGRPARGMFLLFDMGTGVRHPAKDADQRGTVTMDHWSGGDIRVVRTVPSFTPAPPPSTVGTIRAAQVRDGRATLVLPPTAGRGSILVAGGPDVSPPVFAEDAFGTRHGPVGTSRGLWIQDLEAGPYFVGTAPWLDGLVSQGLRPGTDGCESLVTTVEPDLEAPIVWDPRWAATRPITGRVIAAPECLATLALRPWYGLSSGDIRAFDDLRIYLDADGRYVIPAGAPVPERLLVCPSSDSYWIQVLQSFLPGDNVEIPSGTLRIEWSGEPPAGGYATILHRPGSLSFDASFEQARPKSYYCRWNTSEPLVFRAVPTGTNQISVQVEQEAKKRTSFPVRIHPTQPATLTVSLGLLTDRGPQDRGSK